MRVAVIIATEFVGSEPPAGRFLASCTRVDDVGLLDQRVLDVRVGNVVLVLFSGR